MEKRSLPTDNDDSAALLGITKAQEPPRLLLETPTLSTLLPAYDFVRAEFGSEIEGAIHLEYRRYLVTLEGQNLGRLFRAIHVNEIAAIAEWKEEGKAKPSDCYVTRIIVAPLSEDDQPSRDDDDLAENP